MQNRWDVEYHGIKWCSLSWLSHDQDWLIRHCIQTGYGIPRICFLTYLDHMTFDLRIAYLDYSKVLLYEIQIFSQLSGFIIYKMLTYSFKKKCSKNKQPFIVDSISSSIIFIKKDQYHVGTNKMLGKLTMKKFFQDQLMRCFNK